MSARAHPVCFTWNVAISFIQRIWWPLLGQYCKSLWLLVAAWCCVCSWCLVRVLPGSQGGWQQGCRWAPPCCSTQPSRYIRTLWQQHQPSSHTLLVAPTARPQQVQPAVQARSPAAVLMVRKQQAAQHHLAALARLALLPCGKQLQQQQPQQQGRCRMQAKRAGRKGQWFNSSSSSSSSHHVMASGQTPTKLNSRGIRRRSRLPRSASTARASCGTCGNAQVGLGG